MPEVTIQPERVLKDLRELWVQLGNEQEDAGGVLRACAMTLVVIVESDAEAQQVRQTLGVLMHDHPSRAIVLRAIEGAPLEARVFAECWMPFGRNQQICSEGIEMTADATNLGEVAHLLIPLLVPDLPVVMWCHGGRFFGSRYFDPLFPIAQKIIVDSRGAANGKGAIAVLKEFRSRGTRVADLAWTRLTGWREALAHSCEESLRTSTAARIEYGGPLSSSVLYFARWIERAAPSTVVTLAPVPGDAGLRSITFSGGTQGISVKLADAGSLEVQASGCTSRSMLPAASEDALMREELSILGSDPVFEGVLKG
jgi:glucose-6-phosphate dehydrogenase assembly protein OpcA